MVVTYQLPTDARRLKFDEVKQRWTTRFEFHIVDALGTHGADPSSSEDSLFDRISCFGVEAAFALSKWGAECGSDPDAQNAWVTLPAKMTKDELILASGLVAGVLKGLNRGSEPSPALR